MADEFVVKRAERTQARLRLALQGSSGGGKTATSLLLAKGMVQALGARGALPKHLDGVYIGLLDTERDSAKLYSHLVPFDTVVLTPPYTVDRYLAALGALERVGYPVIIVDQISHEWSGDGGILAQVSAAAGQNDFAKWNGRSQDHERFIDALLRSLAHLIVTMRAKTEWVLEEKEVNGRKKKVPTRIGMQAQQRAGIEFEFTTVLDLAAGTNAATCLKDRTELWRINESVGRMGPEWGVRLIDWVYSSSVPEPLSDPEPTPAMRVAALCDSWCRRVEVSATLPDLAQVFDAGQKALRAQSVEAGKDVVVPLLERLVAAKESRKLAFGSEPVPGVALINEARVFGLDNMLAAGRIDRAEFLSEFGVARIGLLPAARLEEALSWIVRTAGANGFEIQVPVMDDDVSAPVPEASGKAAVDAVIDKIARERAASSAVGDLLVAGDQP